MVLNSGIANIAVIYKADRQLVNSVRISQAHGITIRNNKVSPKVLMLKYIDLPLFKTL